MSDFEKIKNYLLKWVGYCEKDKLADLGQSMEQPEGFTKNQGSKNYTIFAKDLYKAIKEDYQAQPWCDTFIDICFIKVFGIEQAKKYLCGFSSYTPYSADFFKRSGRYSKNPTLGAIVFFKNTKRIHHTGFVYAIDNVNKEFLTIEGNTNKTDGVVANGGMVCIKRYSFNNKNIDGFGNIGYKVKTMNGWEYKNDKWKFYKNGQLLKNYYFSNNGLFYCVDSNGDMITGQIFINGKRHYFCEVGNFVGAELKIDDSKKEEVRIHEYTS
jgi:hypothetical protein